MMNLASSELSNLHALNALGVGWDFRTKLAVQGGPCMQLSSKLTSRNPHIWHFKHRKHNSAPIGTCHSTKRSIILTMLPSVKTTYHRCPLATRTGDAEGVRYAITNAAAISFWCCCSRYNCGPDCRICDLEGLEYDTLLGNMYCCTSSSSWKNALTLKSNRILQMLDAHLHIVNVHGSTSGCSVMGSCTR